jgi:hypothetical protein
LVNSSVFFPTNNGPITFDSVTSNFTITDLASSATLNGAYISYTLVSSVPEPENYALMLAGVGLVGFIARRKKSASA